jgi:hypothetical protein
MLKGRVEKWRGGLGGGMSVYRGFPCVAQNRTPYSVSTSRSSNRTGAFNASGSPTGFTDWHTVTPDDVAFAGPYSSFRDR